MNLDLQNSEWVAEWTTFTDTIHTAFRAKAVMLETDHRRYAKIRHLLELVDGLMGELSQELHGDEMHRILDNTERANESRFSIVITGAEMAYVNEQYQIDHLRSVEDTDEAMEATQTVKDSIEKFFRFIPKHKEILHGLNELLSLGRAI
ncbi:hypothetical protein GCM10017044_10470 [Kordiimonas sediminis]|uniref:Uncharacterized protein n=1 Tax=Kordiimonas sediminis TaxID=1735581 RepID=A0A919E652_9PROT|nr:hypothetical protein [Kordiimonas sediminis]GHF17899.1 hypothetical protein GCM10017044_10470 [Kordiimonas sediminis]